MNTKIEINVLRVLLINIAVMLTLVACSSSESDTFRTEDSISSDMAGMPLMAAEGFASSSPAGRSISSKASSMSVEAGGSNAVDRMNVRTSSIDILVQDVQQTIESIKIVTNQTGGFVVTSQISGDESQVGWMSIRIPSSKLETTLSHIRNLAVRITQENSSVQDVTDQYIDLEAELLVLTQTRNTYLKLLERAKNVEETLKVHQAATNIQVQIEQITGRMKYLETTSSNALITIDIRPSTNPESLVKPGWNPTETTKDAIRGLSELGQNIVDMLILILIFSPAWMPIIAFIWFVMRKRRINNQSS